jgi:Glycosyltransferase family 9 (heptosyltransferase)
VVHPNLLSKRWILRSRLAAEGWHGRNAELASVTILNGFGISLGDGIIGLQALRAAMEFGAIRGEVVLARHATPAKPLVPQLYDLARDFASNVPMTEAAARFDSESGKVIDIRDFALDPGFARTSMVDFFLARLGLDPGAVPPALKRNAWLAPRAKPLPEPPGPAGYVLVCPKASIPLRDMPEAVHAALLARLARRGVSPVLTQGPASSDALPAAPCGTLLELCALVAAARCVISTDTATVHLADAFGVPCLAFFTTHRPEWRMRDYPRCQAVHLPPPTLPESLEFARSAADFAAAEAAWFPDGADLGWLDRALTDFGV